MLPRPIRVIEPTGYPQNPTSEEPFLPEQLPPLTTQDGRQLEQLDDDTGPFEDFVDGDPIEKDPEDWDPDEWGDE